MRVEHDESVGIVYIYLNEGVEVAETFILADGINVDVDEDGNALGVEIESTQELREWVEAPIRHRLKLDSRIRRN